MELLNMGFMMLAAFIISFAVTFLMLWVIKGNPFKGKMP